MLGAIIGDIVGSRWEFNPTNDYDFELFSDKNNFTDDTVCTIAVADAILHKKGFGTTLHEWCRRYPHPMGSYGGRFGVWVRSDDPKPYGSFGNGSAMRVSAVGWAFGDEESVLANAEASAACTHNHPEGIKGAQTVALAIHLALKLRKKYAGRTITQRAIREMVIEPCVAFSGYDINIDWESVRNKFDETCQGTVPVALAIIAQSHSFEDAIRKAVCLGADADTLGAIVGSIAEVIWPMPDEMRKKALSILPQEMRKVVQDFCKVVRPHVPHYVPQDDMRLHNLVIMRWKLGLGNLNNAMFAGKSPVPEKKKVATMDMGEFIPMPTDSEDVSDVEMDFTVPAAQMEILRYGHIPEVQEDHWFMVCDEEYIRYFRSWTGACVFEAHYHKQNDGDYCIDRLKMHHGLCEFGVNGNEAGIALFIYLIVAEVGDDAERAWDDYLYAWDALDYKYSVEQKKYDVATIVDRFKNGEMLDYLFFWGHHEKAGKVTKACLSQWYPCEFVIDGITYHYAEQYMMAEKARLFHDEPTLQRILDATDPSVIKQLGREVRNFDADKWTAASRKVVYKGNKAKFGQNAPLRDFLFSTGDKILVEASPYDRIWGIGMKADEKDVEDPTQWKGSNQLGVALMWVRDALKAEQ